MGNGAVRGYQGSETTRARVSIYPIDIEDRGLSRARSRSGRPRSGNPIHFLGKSSQDGGGPVLVGMGTSKAFGSASGKWYADVKIPRSEERDFLYGISDDDWAEVRISRHTQDNLVMVGLVDDVRRLRQTNGSATETTFRISGSDHGKVFEVSPIMFDQVTDGAAGLSAIGRVLATKIAEDPARTVEKILAGFLGESANFGRGLWNIPSTFPRIAPGFRGGSLIDLIAYFDRDFDNAPKRKAELTASLFSGFNTSIWGLAEEWSDAILCELYTDLLQLDGDASAQPRATAEYQFPTQYTGVDYPRPIANTQEFGHVNMVPAVIFRDRPLPMRPHAGADGRVRDTWDQPWLKRVPVHEISPGEIGHQFDVGRNGYSRLNAFYMGSNLTEKLESVAVLNGLPIWDTDSMRAHGIRRFDVRSNYTAFDLASKDGLAGVLDKIRRRTRDFHAMNHIWLDGPMALNHCRPEIRIGSRLRITNDNTDLQETYYVESAAHNWEYGSASSAFLLTHGWIGTDEELVATFKATCSVYRTADANGVLLDDTSTVDTDEPLDVEHDVPRSDR